MSRTGLLLLAAASGLAVVSCGSRSGGLAPADLPIETSLGFTNLSTRFYAALGVRAHGAGEFVATPLLPPGATHRVRWLDILDTSCPDAVDLRLFLYQRVHEDLPIGLDDGEAVEDAPIVAGEVLDLPACGVQTLETYTVVNWDAEPGTARLKIAQNTPVDDAIRASGVFPNADAAWDVSGVDPALTDVTTSPAAESELIAGRVALVDGTGVEGIGVLIRTRFRVRPDDDDPDNDPDAGFSAPIDFSMTDALGAFSFHRPSGAYRIEFFSDDFAFRPAMIDVESPIGVILTVAEPL